MTNNSRYSPIQRIPNNVCQKYHHLVYLAWLKQIEIFHFVRLGRKISLTHLFPHRYAATLHLKILKQTIYQFRKKKLTPATLDIESVFDIPADDDDLYFAFEAQHTPF